MQHIIYIMGVSGSGKTTTGQLLSKKTGIPFFDADDYHPEKNKEKMKAGHPLNDDDRAGWLAALHSLAMAQQDSGGAIIACSALKEKYRAVLASGIRNVWWVFLQGSYETIKKRLENRQGHYMPPTLLHSQFDSLEEPTNALVVDIAESPESIVQHIHQHIFR